MFVPARKEDPVKTRKASPNRAPRRILKIACGAALAVAFTAVPPASALAEKVTPPPVPAEIAVPAGNRAYLEGHAVGTQNYICLQAGVGFSWTFIGPQATLFDDNFKLIELFDGGRMVLNLDNSGEIREPPAGQLFGP